MNSTVNSIKKIYFRFDAGGLIGFGHLGRMEAIAEECSAQGLEAAFIIRKRPSLISTHFNFPVERLS